MAGDAKIIVMSEAKAQVLEKLLEAFAPIVDDLEKSTVAILGLRLADGSSRTVKIIQTSIEDSAPASPLPAGSGTGEEVPTGYSEVELEYCDPTLGNATGTFLVKNPSAIT